MKHILIIDNEPLTLKVTQRFLDHKYKVTGIDDAHDALNVFQSRKYDFDMVIIDYKLNDIDGDILAGMIHDIRKDVPIVLVTGTVPPDMTFRAWTDVLVKPVLRSTLLRTVIGTIGE